TRMPRPLSSRRSKRPRPPTTTSTHRTNLLRSRQWSNQSAARGSVERDQVRLDQQKQRAAQRQELLGLLVTPHPLADRAFAVEPRPKLARSGADAKVLGRGTLPLDAAHPFARQLFQPRAHRIERQPGHAGTEDLERIEAERKRLAPVHPPAIV